MAETPYRSLSAYDRRGRRNFINPSCHGKVSQTDCRPPWAQFPEMTMLASQRREGQLLFRPGRRS